MTKNDIAADNFIPVMELQAANSCRDALVFRRNLEMFQRFPGICNSANLRTPTVPSGTLNLWLKESEGLRKENIEGKP